MRSYNHARFLPDAIESVLSQRADFDFEIIIGDDCSHDETLQIINRYLALDGRIRVVRKAQNVGSMRNLIDTYAACSGEYVAFLDGDDFWTDANKLQAQADCLDGDSSIALCGHQWFVEHYPPGSGPRTVAGPKRKTLATLADFARGFHMTQSTLMVRRSCLPEIPGWLEAVRLEDIVIEFLCATQGAMACLMAPMCVYRHHGAGKHSQADTIGNLEAIALTWEAIRERIDRSCHKAVDRRLLGTYYRLADAYGASGRWEKSIAVMERAAQLASVNDKIRRALMRAFPQLYNKLYRLKSLVSHF